MKPRKAKVRGPGLPKRTRGQGKALPSRSPALQAQDALQQYFGALQGLPLLDAAQEISLAREIEALEIAHWRALLSARAPLAVVACAIGLHLQGQPRRLEALRQRAPAARPTTLHVARELRRLDRTRAGLRAADAAVHTAFSDNARAQAYLARVAIAARAEQRAKNRFVAANLRLVIAMAQRYRRSPLALEDLIQEGNLGLMRAVERFDHRRGLRFSTYASWWIRHALNRAVSDKARVVRIPVHAFDDLSRVARAIDSVQTKTGATPGIDELAARIGMPVTKLAQLKLVARLEHPLSLDRSPAGDHEQTLHDRLAAADAADPDQQLDLASWREDVPRLLRVLRPIEAAILRLRFGLDGSEELTLKQIGEQYNLSRERIRQLQVIALDKLRAALEHDPHPGGSGEAAA